MASDNYKKVRLILAAILLVNLAVAILKIITGSIIKSASMVADGIHSLTDGSSNVVGLIGIKIASKPVDEGHPYGHRKYETLSGLFIGVMLVILGIKIIAEAVGRFANPVMPQITAESLIILAITLCINIFISIYEHKQGKKLKSQILISDSLHTRSDIYISIGVLLTLLCVKLGLPPVMDSITSLAVAGFILHASYEIFKSSCDILADGVAIDTEIIRAIAMSFNKVKDTHKIRSRGSHDNVYIDMHIMTEPHMSVEESHKLIHDIEDKIKREINENIQVIIHIEPFREPAEEE